MSNRCNEEMEWIIHARKVISTHNLEALKKLIENYALEKPIIEISDNLKLNLLDMAGVEGFLAGFSFLITKGFDPNQRDGEGNGVAELMLCTLFMDKSVSRQETVMKGIEICLKEGVDINHRTTAGWNLMSLSARFSCWYIFENLLKLGAQPDDQLCEAAKKVMKPAGWESFEEFECVRRFWHLVKVKEEASSIEQIVEFHKKDSPRKASL